MAITIDPQWGKQLAELLHKSFLSTGIHGHTEMPEDELPKGMVRGSPEHLLFITLTVSIDYQRSATTLWEIQNYI